MPTQLKITFPPLGSAYPPSVVGPVNSINPIKIDNPHFKGEISVWIKDYQGLKKKGNGEEYFGEKGREGMTYGIVVRGGFVMEISRE